MRRIIKKSDLGFIFLSFIIWRIGILIVAAIAIKFIPTFSQNYFGGGYSNYITNPLFLGHFNFDGEHYLAIAQNGYSPLKYFFFPVFPMLMRFLNTELGFIVSNLSFFVALVGIYKLVKIDYKERIAKLTVLLFLIFPTSFYFGVFYTESIFLALVVWSFLLARNNKFLFASILAAIASATKVVGGIIFPILALEIILQKKKNFLSILIAPFGVLAYMYYLLKTTGDGLIFLHQVSVFGEQRSSTLILLPQVIYRYLFKILPNVSYSYFPNVFTTYLEFGIAILFLILIIICFFKLRLSYSVYAFLAYLIPTLSGSFSSMSRYVLVIFPVFILLAQYLNKLPKIYTYIIFSVMLLLLVIAESLFWRGYWIS